MPKKASKRRKFNLRRVRVAASIGLGALASLDVVNGVIVPASTNTYRLVSAKLAFNISDIAAAIDDGAEVGIAHGDYTAQEIEDCLEAQTAIDIGNLVEQELADRRVRSLGYAVKKAQGTDDSASLNDGQPIKIRLNWLIGIGDTFNVWVRNGSDTVWTIGGNILVLGEVWVKD